MRFTKAIQNDIVHPLLRRMHYMDKNAANSTVALRSFFFYVNLKELVKNQNPFLSISKLYAMRSHAIKHFASKNQILILFHYHTCFNHMPKVDSI